jgi:hypothetical protein
LPDAQLRIYTDLVMASLDEAARHALEELMNTGGYQYQSEFARKHYAHGMAEGEAKGEAKAILEVLKARGLAVPSDLEARVKGCADVVQLDEWLRRAAVAGSLEEIFR